MECAKLECGEYKIIIKSTLFKKKNIDVVRNYPIFISYNLTTKTATTMFLTFTMGYQKYEITIFLKYMYRHSVTTENNHCLINNLMISNLLKDIFSTISYFIIIFLGYFNSNLIFLINKTEKLRNNNDVLFRYNGIDQLSLQRTVCYIPTAKLANIPSLEHRHIKLTHWTNLILNFKLDKKF